MAAEHGEEGAPFDLRERLTKAAKACDDLQAVARINGHERSEIARLGGKAEGLRLALSYLNEWFDAIRGPFGSGASSGGAIRGVGSRQDSAQ